MSALLPADKKQVSLNVLPRQEPFEILYRLNCDNLCADFHEDLEFRFSWGLTSIISRFAGKKATSHAVTNYLHRVSMLWLSLPFV
jgi:mitofusin